MEGYKLLLKDIKKGLIEGNLTRKDILDMVNFSCIDEIYKEGLLRFIGYTDLDNMLWKIEDAEDIDFSRRVALFKKVSRSVYNRDSELNGIKLNESGLLDSYNGIKLPQRGTKGSAGYDFFSPIDICLKPGESIVVCTGIRCLMKENWVLKAYPRSSSGTKYRVQFNNTVPIIDSDYYYSENEGHIMFKIFNDGREGKDFILNKGEKLCQGIFLEYGITFDDDVSTERTGGFGSTGK